MHASLMKLQLTPCLYSWKKVTLLTRAKIAAILREILWGLSFLHLAKHFHCDVKPSRVHFSIEGSVKLAGRGLPPSYKARRSSALGLRMSVFYTHMPLTLI